MNTSNHSTMFLNDVTAIDLAYLTEDGRVLGRSVRPQITVTGVIDPEEKVVVDFSTVKKFLKAKIDDKENGYDHKLCIPLNAAHNYLREPGSTYYRIQTASCDLTVPANAVRCFTEAAAIERMDVELEAYLQECLRAEYGDAFHSVQVTLNADMQIVHHPVRSRTGLFNYVHGLKSSTSWGCQNIAHGHSSFFQFLGTGPNRVLDTEQEEKIITQIENELRDAVFVFADNLKLPAGDGGVQLTYSTPRGRFDAFFDLEQNNVFVLDTETTIEFLVNFFAERYGQAVRDLGYRYIVVSEGLSKGAQIDLYASTGE